MEKEWELVDIAEYLKAFEKMIRETHKVRKVKKSYDYKGPEITHHSILAACPDIKNDMTEESLKYHSERGRNMLQVILLKAFQLGYNQSEIKRILDKK